MKSNNVSKDNNKNININISKINLRNLKSDYFLKKIYDNLEKKKSLEIVKYNKKIQNRLALNIKDYQEYCETYSRIEIEIIPIKNRYNKFINIDKNEKTYYHIYFNDSEEEIKNKYEINFEDKITKIRVVIDYQIKSFQNLFNCCGCIEYINFKKFYRNNIIDMNYMFNECSSLKGINFSNFNANNVTNMNHMFYQCSSLKELNLSNFYTNNVKYVRAMFSRCSSLKELKLPNFNTNNVVDMSYMFYECSSLKELNLSNFNTNNVKNMSCMFDGCSSFNTTKSF